MSKIKKRRIAIIPARGGSERIKDKNIRHFFGRPIIYHTLDYAIESKLFDKIHVSTDSAAIKELVLDYGINIDFMRPLSLADSYTPIFDVLQFVVSKFTEKMLFFDEVWLLMPCAPLLTAQYLIEASNQFDVRKGALIAVAELPIPVEWAYRFDEDDILRLETPDAHVLRSQDLKTTYYDAGAFAIFSAQSLKTEHFNGDCLQAYVLPREVAIDIDTEEDWLFAEKMYSVLRGVNKGVFREK